MKKVELGKPNIILNEKLNKNYLYLDTQKMDALKKDALKQLDIISKSLSQIESVLNKMSLKKSFSDEYNSLSLQIAKRCSSQSQNAKDLMTSLNDMYNDDAKNVLLRNLDERISYLESIVLSNKD